MGKSTVLVLLLALGSMLPAAQDKKSQADKEVCLECHGPFEKLAKATENWQSPAGEKANPHTYVPHDTKDIPQCIECHPPHPIPLQDKSAVVKPKDVDFCYSGCHHPRNLQPCQGCH